MKKSILGMFYTIAVLCLAVGACRASQVDEPKIVPADGVETAVIEISLAGPITSPDAELSGMAWYGDTLILVPQYPDFNGPESVLFAIAKTEILAVVEGKSTKPIRPRVIPFESTGIERRLSGFQGYEAIAFLGERALLTVEAQRGAVMNGFLVQGWIAPDLSQLTVVEGRVSRIEQPVNLINRSDETIVIADEAIVTLYESNGAAINETPLAHLFDWSGVSIGSMPFATIPFRVTDATAIDDNNRFWVINYNFPGDGRLQEADTLIEPYIEGATHRQSAGVERLVEMQYAADGITLINQPPIQLVLLEDELRNWEGIVRLDDLGFLLVTDKFPTTILGFVPYASP